MLKKLKNMLLNNLQRLDFSNPYEVQSDTVSLTVPNQSMTVREIVERFVRGQDIDSISHDVYYDGLEDYDRADPTLRPDFDLSDYSAISEEIEERIRAKAEQQALTEAERSEANDEARSEVNSEKTNETAQSAVNEDSTDSLDVSDKQ